MRIIMLFLLLPQISFFSFTMELPPPQEAITEISAEIKTKYHEEKLKFENYDLDHPEKFLALLRKQLKKEENEVAYIANLQLLASKLFFQHIIMQHAAYTQYLIGHIKKLKEMNNQILPLIGELQFGKFLPLPETFEQLNEVLLHWDILTAIRPFSPMELSIIFSWIVDASKGKWLNLLGKSQVIVHELTQTLALKEKEETALGKIMGYFIKSELIDFQKKIRIITQNIPYLLRVVDNTKFLFSRLQKQAAHDKASKLVEDAYDKEEKQIAALYQATHHWYKKLYKIVREELSTTIGALLRKDPANKKLLNYIDILPSAEGFIQNIPKILPKELPLFIAADKPAALAAGWKAASYFKVKIWYTKGYENYTKDL